MRMKLMKVLFFVLILLVFSSSLMAQGERVVSGKVLDTSKAPVGKASVILFYETQGDTLRTLSNSQGEYRFTAVKSRPFFINISFNGFQAEQRKITNDKAEVVIDPIYLLPSYRSMQ